MIVSPSLLSANFANLSKDVEMVNQSEAEWLHLDIMDGVFVPNISFGFPVIKAVRKICTKKLDVHLMIENPQNYISTLKDCGADLVSLHYEACVHLDRAVHAIKDAGMKAGVALNPSTPVAMLRDIVAELDFVLLMSVNPGFGGQKFIANTVQKVHDIKALIAEKNSSAIIQVDGGVNAETGKQLAEAGVHSVVAGNYVFGAADPMANIKLLHNL